MDDYSYKTLVAYLPVCKNVLYTEETEAPQGRQFGKIQNANHSTHTFMCLCRPINFNHRHLWHPVGPTTNALRRRDYQFPEARDQIGGNNLSSLSRPIQ